MSSLNQDDDLEVDLPKMKTISKPKNLKKRRRDTPEEEDPADESKKAKIEGEDDESEVSRLEELKMLQQSRSRSKGSDMSSERVLLSKAAIGGTEEGSIASLTSHFTGQRAKVNTLDTRMEEFIEQEMAKRKALLAESTRESGTSKTQEEVARAKAELEAAEKEEAAERERANKLLEVKSHDLPAGVSSGSAPQAKAQATQHASGPKNPNVIDLSNASLRATSSTSSSAAPANDAPAKKWHKEGGGGGGSGILEVDLPVEEQLRMYEATRLAAIEALKAQKKRRHNNNDRDDFVEYEAGEQRPSMVAGNVAADFSKHKKSNINYGNRATDAEAFDKYKKKQQTFR